MRCSCRGSSLPTCWSRRRRLSPRKSRRQDGARRKDTVELWKVSREATVLTRPLLLYYSMLNLVRGVMLPRLGTFGEPSHGLSFTSASTLLDCKATVTKNGTFRRFAESLGATGDLIEGRSYTLRDL